MNDKLSKHFRFKMIAAFAGVYIIWGTTYLAIRYGVETIPALLMAGVRFLIAGSMLYGFARWKGMAKPTPLQWKQAAISGALLFLGGNGGLTWSEQYIPSGLAALLVASVPFWIVLFSTMQGDRSNLSPRILGGVLLGFAGLVYLINPGSISGESGVYILGIIAVVISTISWAYGSLYARKAKMPSSPVMTSGMQMLAGGAALVLSSLVTGELRTFSLANVSPASVLSFGYLVVFGSLGFLAYAWLLTATSPARVATYAYVNPMVALVVGWAIGGEQLTGHALVAAGIIVAGVMLIISQKSSSGKAPEEIRATSLPESVKPDSPHIVTRVWHGVTPASKAEEYVRYLQVTGEKDCLETKGNRGVRILKRVEGEKAHVVFVSLWESYDAIKKFAGDDITRAVFYPKDKEYLIEAETTVNHYEVASENMLAFG